MSGIDEHAHNPLTVEHSHVDGFVHTHFVNMSGITELEQQLREAQQQRDKDGRMMLELLGQLDALREALRRTLNALIAAPYLFGVLVPQYGLGEIDKTDHSAAIHAATRALLAQGEETPRSRAHTCGGPPYGYATWCRGCEPDTIQDDGQAEAEDAQTERVN